jgi:hypothetical protein
MQCVFITDIAADAEPTYTIDSYLVFYTTDKGKAFCIRRFE